jgi:signal transduction histidine kinase
MGERPDVPSPPPPPSALPPEWATVRTVLDQFAREMPSCALFVVDQELRFIFAGGKALEAGQINGPALIGRPLHIAVDPALALMYEPEYLEVLAGGTFEHEHASHGRFYSSRGMPLRDATGAVYAALVCSFDITERHSAEVHREERARVLLEADRQKDEFLWSLGHELRNPLAAISNGLRATLKLYGSDSVARTSLEMMQRQLKHVVRLVEDLQDLAHVRTGAIMLQPQKISIQEVLQQSIEASRAAIERHEHKLEVREPAAPLIVMGDRDRLAQVFTNLLVNSCKYSQQGGLIELDVSLEDSEAVVRVSDTGVGIPPEDLEWIFEKFSQHRAHRARSEKGFGFGLSLVKEIATLHGGSVMAESPGVDQGSVFTVRLPVSRT